MATTPRRPLTLNVLATGRIQVWIGFTPWDIYNSWQHWFQAGVPTFCGPFGDYEVAKVTTNAVFDWGARWYPTGSVTFGDGYSAAIYRDQPTLVPGARYAVSLWAKGLGDPELQIAGDFNDAVALLRAWCRTWNRWQAVQQEAA